MDKALIASWPGNLAKLTSRLAGRDIALPVPAGETVFILRPETAALEFPGDSETGGADFILEANGENWEIRAWGRAAEALFAPPEGLNAEDIPAELKPAFLALTLEPLLDRAAHALGHTLRLAFPPPAGAGREGTGNPESFILPFTLADQGGIPAGAGRACIPLRAASLSLLADLAKLFPRRAPADCSALPLTLSLCAGRESFPVKILREAEPGDVLVFSGPAEPVLTLEAGGRALWTASLADGGIRLEGILNQNPEEAAMTAENTEPQTTGLSDIDALEITITLELDERRLTLRELAALGPGQILDTAASLDTPVTIKAGGRAVGRGRLVEVGDRLGVLIASLELDAQGGGRKTP